MNIKFVTRDKVKPSRKRSSKFKPLLDAVDKLEPGGKALEVSYRSDKSVNSMRTAIYQYNQENDATIKSSKDAENKRVFFYRVKK
ncbi:MAG: hypothetical protein ACNA78_07255 [Balneolaceae bacterium]